MLRPRLHEYLAGCLKTAKAIPESVGGTADHVDLLASLRGSHSAAALVKDLKTASTHWLRTEAKLQGFEWQAGYGVLSVSASNLTSVRRYIENQEEHHRVRTFEDEYREFLEKHKVEFDPRYML